MANPNNVWKYAAKNPWHPVAYNVSLQEASRVARELEEQGKKVRRTSMWMKKARVRLHSVWTVPEN